MMSGRPTKWILSPLVSLTLPPLVGATGGGFYLGSFPWFWRQRGPMGGRRIELYEMARPRSVPSPSPSPHSMSFGIIDDIYLLPVEDQYTGPVSGDGTNKAPMGGGGGHEVTIYPCISKNFINQCQKISAVYLHLLTIGRCFLAQFLAQSTDDLGEIG